MELLYPNGSIKGTKSINQYKCVQYVMANVEVPFAIKELVSNDAIIICDETGTDKVLIRINSDGSFSHRHL